MTNSLYLSDLIGIPLSHTFTSAAKSRQLRELVESLLEENSPLYPKASTAKREEILSPTVVFENGYVYDDVKGKYEFIVSLGIFALGTTSLIATITKDNKLEITWTERLGKGKFTSKIPSYLVAISAPVLSYEGGVLNIRVPVESRNKNEALFVGRLESK
jgi:hypothetical protein